VASFFRWVHTTVGVIRLAKRASLAVALIAALLLIGLATHVQTARAENGETPGGDGSLLNSLLPPSEGGTNNTPQPTVSNAEAGTTGTPAAAATTGDSDSSGSTDSSASTTGTGYGPAIVPAVTPLVVDQYATTPGQLESGSRFQLKLTIANHGTDDAEGVVVRIGPSAGSGWGSSEEFAVLGTGSAKFVGTIKAGASDDSASFQLIANPALAGGLRSIPVQVTWRSGQYEHSASEAVGLLVNSCVGLDASFVTSAPVVKEPFRVTLKVKNASGRPVRSVRVTFSGKGARPSTETTIVVGDVPPGTVGAASATFTAPLVGRAQLLATISYTDDFGDLRTVQAQGWAHVERAPAASEETSSSDAVGKLVLTVAALLGLSG
jgi:hypothetical protein